MADVESDELFGSDGSDNDLETKPNDQSTPPAEKESKKSSVAGPSRYENRNEMDDLFGGSEDDEYNESSLGRQVEISSFVKAKSSSTSRLCLPSIPKIPPENSTMVLRMPKFIKIETEPYYSDKYDKSAEENKYSGASAVIRWRYKVDKSGEVVQDSNGEPAIESNARIVKWSDGTYQILVGRDTFEGKVANLNHNYIFSREKSAPPPNRPDLLESDITCITCLDSICKVQQRLTLQPASLASDSHARFAKVVADRYKKKSRIVMQDMTQIIENPEKRHAELEARENEEQRKERRRRASMNDSDLKYHRSRRGMMTASYLEEGMGMDDESGGLYDSTDIRAIKRGIGAGSKARPGKAKSHEVARRREMEDFIEEDGDEEEDDEEDDWEVARKQKAATKRNSDKNAEDEEEDEEEEDEDEDEDEEEDEEEEDEEEEDDEDSGEEEGNEDEAVSKKKKRGRETISRSVDKDSRKRPEGLAAGEKEGVAISSGETRGEDDGDEETKAEKPQQKRVRRAIIDDDDDE